MTFTNHNILVKLHFCFWRNKSTVSAIIFSLKIFITHLDNDYTLDVSLVLSKAFETVNHATVFTKLDQCGYEDSANCWFQSYLIDRKQINCSNRKCIPNPIIKVKYTCKK